MELAPRYCRTCGSRILVKHICHNCNNDPLKGDNYCYDCGALTPNADSCLKCGARYKQSIPIKPIIYAAILIVAISVGAYLFLDRGTGSTQEISQQKDAVETPVPSPAQEEIPAAQKPIINNPVVDTAKIISTTKTDTAVRINIIKKDTIEKKNNTIDSANAKKALTNVFTSSELNAYNSKCSYFEKGMKNKVLFFIAGGSGYIKMNDKIVELKRKRKGVDVAVFSSNEYEVVLTIDGLSGSAKEWLASCTINIKDITQNSSARHKVYSSCIEL